MAVSDPIFLFNSTGIPLKASSKNWKGEQDDSIPISSKIWKSNVPAPSSLSITLMALKISSFDKSSRTSFALLILTGGGEEEVGGGEEEVGGGGDGEYGLYLLASILWRRQSLIFEERAGVGFNVDDNDEQQGQKIVLVFAQRSKQAASSYALAASSAISNIGQGTYSSVFRAREVETGRMVALKKVFEYMEYDLSGLSSCPYIKFSDAQVKCYMKQLLMGLEHCHLRNVMHRDIKASNILVNNQGVLKLGDFGLANILTSKNKHRLTSRIVTLCYRPPELLMGSTSYDVTVDQWSVGCDFAEVLMGKPILKGRTKVEQLHKIFKLCGSPPDEYWTKLKLPHSTMFRPQHPYESCLRQWCKEIPATALNLFETHLSIEPHKRGTASSALASEYFCTKPYPCEPSSLPKYSPKKDFDAKQQDDLRRKKFGAKIRDPVGVMRKARRPRKSLQEANNFDKTVAKEQDNGVTANHPKPKAGLNQPVDTRSETSQVTTVSRGDVFTAPPPVTGSSSFAWAKKQKEARSTLSYNQPSSISEIIDSSIFILKNADTIFNSSKQENQDVSEGVIDQQADLFDAIDGFPRDYLMTKHKNKARISFDNL
ncbi:putative serine/threonine-protein kinase [Hibiscus syriacus]|uniref:Serine/threonine-protein kinase n=1 Tax=Hibiscus syriacus TaxID=106335 RepID=A0A6A3CAI3_HIBSY|nr:putative serine/threonine-protein kinase [Hibiscus syriacus]